MIRRIKNSGFSPLAVSLSILISLLLCELGCRIYLMARFRRPSAVSYAPFGYDRSPLLAFEMEPLVRNKHLPYLRTTFSTNSRGFRGTDEFAPKEPGEIRIAVLGESAAFGYGASSDATTIAGFLKEKMQENFPSRRISVINAANPGYVSYQILAKLQLRVIDLDPDFVLLYMGWNDLFYSSRNAQFERNAFWGKDIYFDMDSWQRFITAKNSDVQPAFLRPFALTVFFRKAHDKTLESLNKEKTARALAAGESSPRQKYLMAQGGNREVLAQFYDNLSSILAILKQRKIDAFAVTLFSEKDLLAGDREDINEVIKRAAGETGSSVIDADREVVLKHITGVNQPYPDEYHLTDKGNEFLAALAAEKISAQIRRRK